MHKVIIGCDPDSNKSGFAYYMDGNLTDLKSMRTIDFFIWMNGICSLGEFDIEIHIENLDGNSSNSFNVRSNDPLPVKLKKAEHVGKCKQAQIEIERIAEHFNIKVVRHRVSKMWKSSKLGREQLKNATGYEGKSNEDTRSAAYFGWLGLKSTLK